MGLMRAIRRGLFLIALLPALAAAQQPAVNLGFTSFLDGGAPAGPGFYFQEYLEYYTADSLKNQHGNDTNLLKDLNVWVSLNQLIYASDQKLLGGNWGVDLIVPLVSLDVDPEVGSPLSSNHQGLGDIVIGPFLQWGPIMGAKGPIFMHRVEFQNLIPTGKYDDDHILNPGSNFYSLDPYWAATVFLGPKAELSWRVHYLWNAKNDDPNKLLSNNAEDTQAGQAVHLNFASSYEVVEKMLRLGISGYYLKQFTNNEANGQGIADSREQVLAIGPGALFSFSQDDHIFVNTYFQTAVENRPSGMQFNLRWTHHF